jgi:hypothetical protein
MLRFLCICGAVFRDDEEPPGASCVAYPLDELSAIEARIAKYVASLAAARSEAAREAWLKGHFDGVYPTDATDLEVIEDIIGRELNEGFIAMFRCPSCNRVGLCDPGSKAWAFYRLEPGEPEG